MSQQPFEGIRVIEFGQFVAVPVTAQLMAEGGAEVIKIEALGGDPIRFIRAQGASDSKHFICRNRGKECLPLDLSNPLAKPVLEALLNDADVVLMNLRPGVAEKIGIAPEQLNKKYPRLVIGSLSGFGNAGPEAGDGGLDLVVQARSGLMAANGRVVNGRPAAIDVNATVDTMGATMLAFGICSALLRREKTGVGGIVSTNLLMNAMTMAASGMCRAVERDKKEYEEVLKRLKAKQAEGASWEEQLEAAQPVDVKAQKILSNVYWTTYATKDSFIAVACGNNVLRTRLCNALGVVDEGISPDFTGDYETHYTNLLSLFSNRFASQTCEHWVSVLRKVGVPASKVFMQVELFEDEQVKANQMLYDFEHHSAGTVTALSPPLSLDEDGFRPAYPNRAFGADSEAVLTKIGFSKEQIDELMAAGISHKGL